MGTMGLPASDLDWRVGLISPIGSTAIPISASSAIESRESCSVGQPEQPLGAVEGIYALSKQCVFVIP